jgi:hypothetical protein
MNHGQQAGASGGYLGTNGQRDGHGTVVLNLP